MAYHFHSILWMHTGDGAWHFVTLPTDVADEIDDLTGSTKGGFGSVRVTATIGATTWSTSLFPDTASKSYVLPVKKQVRSREGVHHGDPVEVTVEVVHTSQEGATVNVPKPTEADRARFTELVPDGPGVEAKPMFGNLGAFVNGNMFMGLFGSDIGVKLPDDAREELLAQPGAGPFGPEERPMGGWVTLPAGWRADEASLWVDRALTHAAALPPKASKASNAPKKGAPRIR